MKRTLLFISTFIIIAILTSCTNQSDSTTVVETYISVDDPYGLLNDETTSSEIPLPDTAFNVIEIQENPTNYGNEITVVVTNNSGYEIKSLSVICAICDKDGNILDDINLNSSVSVPNNKNITLKETLTEDIDGMSYIIADRYTYDIDGDFFIGEVFANKENAEKTKLVFDTPVEFVYDDVLADKDVYDNKTIILEGKILAKTTKGTTTTIRVDLTPDSFSSNDQIVQVFVNEANISTYSFSNGDLIKITGSCSGLGENSSTGQKSPVIFADKITLL